VFQHFANSTANGRKKGVVRRISDQTPQAASRKAINEILRQIQGFAVKPKWGATALVIDVATRSVM
jgi:hypothetical protein